METRRWWARVGLAALAAGAFGAGPMPGWAQGPGWAAGAALPVAADAPSAIALEGRGFGGGGGGGAGGPGGRLGEWGAPARRWVERDGLPEAVHGFGMAALGRTIMVVGGFRPGPGGGVQPPRPGGAVR